MDNTATSQQQLEEFVDDMLTEKNLPGLTDDVRPEVIKEVVQTLRELINRAIIEALPDDKLDELNKLAEDPSVTNERISELIGASGVDIPHITANTMLRFRELYLAGPEESTR